MEAPGGIRQLLVVGFTGQAFQAAGCLLGLLGEFTLTVACAARCAALLSRGPALAVRLLLLASRELLELLECLLELITGLLAFAAFNGLVLVF